MKKLVIIDTYALVHRSYHALPPLVSPEGILVNGVYGFMLFFLKMISDLKPDYIVATFDMAAPTFRHEEYKEYKAKRVKMPDNFYEQIQIVKDLLKAFHVPILEKEGYEADDIIGTITEKLKNEDIQSFIVTGDLDTLQLITDKVFVYTLRRGIQDSIVYDKEKVFERFQLDPDQLIDWKALRGDPSDNVPGVPSIGEKTASSLIKECGTLDNLYEKIEHGGKIKVSPRILEKLKTFKDQAYFSRHLVTIQKDVDIEFDLEKAKLDSPTKDEVISLLNKLGFRSLIPKIFNLEENISSAKEVSLNIISTTLKTEELKQKINGEETIGVLLDFNGERFGERKIKGLGFSFLDNTLFYLPSNLFPDFFEKQLDWPKKNLISFDAKIILEEIEWFSDCLFEDIKILVWLLDTERKNYKFSSISKFFLGQETDDSFSGSLSKLIPLWEVIKNKTAALGIDNVWENEEKPLVPVIASMEKNGILVDKNWLKKLSKKAEKKIYDLEKKIYQLSGEKFNINSPKQLSEILFEKLEISSSSLRKTATKKISTNVDELLKIKDSHPIIPLIIEYRGITKLKNSFLDTLPNFINLKTNRIHTIWNQGGTTTGRLSSEKPNLQNIPQKGDWGKQIRKAFVSKKSFSLVSLDYSQIELRLAAHLSGDVKMIEAFNQDKDIHKITAAYIHNIPEDKVSASMRQRAKILNFGIIYGMGNKSFAQSADISLDEAKKFREEYFSNFSGLRNYLDFSLENAKKLGYAETIFGRKRFLPLLGGLGRIARGQERIALNMPIQGLAADIIKMAMVKIQELIKKKHMEEDIITLIQIHDELIIEIKSDIIKEIVPIFKDIMENAVKLEVPLKVDVRIGNKWGEME
ncbi:DNA polymerase I [Candidatus Pacearchaeota archaeon]|nr:MAG: DNA polymerase I [Candidatus Pacearchaeota archaeon]